MQLKSGLDTEIAHALNTLSIISADQYTNFSLVNDPELITVMVDMLEDCLKRFKLVEDDENIISFAKLYDMEVQKQMKEITDLRRSQVGSGDRSERIRTYNFPQGRLTDHRLNQNLNVWTVIDGDLDELLKLLIEYDQKLKLEKLAAVG